MCYNMSCIIRTMVPDVIKKDHVDELRLVMTPLVKLVVGVRAGKGKAQLHFRRRVQPRFQPEFGLPQWHLY